MAGLTLDTLREVYNANRTRFKESFQETQPQKKYSVTKLAMKHAKTEDASHTIEWTLRRKAATGSIQAVNPYEIVEGVRDEYDVTMSIKPKHFTSHKERVFSALATIFSKSSKDQLWKDHKMKESSAQENWWGYWESRLWQVPYSADAKDSYLGWLYWLPRSMTSGGVYTEQLRPARNGVYVRLGDGSLVSTAGGLDRATAANARLRGLVSTHRSKMGEVLLNTLQDSVLESGFDYAEGLQGDKPAMDAMSIVWDEDFDRGYGRLLDKLGGPKRRDFFEGGAKSLAGAETVAAEVLNNNFLRPIFGVRHSNLHLVKIPANWGREIETWDGQDVMGKFKSWSSQGRAIEPSTCGFLCHGTFTTGT